MRKAPVLTAKIVASKAISRTPLPRWETDIEPMFYSEALQAERSPGRVRLDKMSWDIFFKHARCKITEVWLMDLPDEETGQK